ncbi:hypothetical protein IEQ34_011553 [Dendrobium chrysotoxum]|uniref:Uncharacterized protein n=1 Tax=Dendrobium chrysotoxum TaxID=161865 RepID=A0AAV7GSK6_DENCH|nr:hypothetical protein IEQ34_011553 [Dendrobium chrysotoxum]
MNREEKRASNMHVHFHEWSKNKANAPLDFAIAWDKACDMHVEEGLKLEDENLKTNERVFKAIMKLEHFGRVQTQGFGETMISSHLNDFECEREGKGKEY